MLQNFTKENSTLLFFRFESDEEESEEEEKIVDKHDKPEPLSAFTNSTRCSLMTSSIVPLIGPINPN